MLIKEEDIYPNGMVGIVVWALREVQFLLRRRIIRTTSLVVIVDSTAVPLEVRCSARKLDG